MSTINVAFAGTWITDVATGESVQCRKTDRSETRQRDVQVRPYAGGRLRIVSTPKRERSTPLTLRGVSESDLEILWNWAGRLLLLRDGQGWRRWGTYAGVAPTTVHPAPEVPVYDVSLTWLDSDYTEAVV